MTKDEKIKRNISLGIDLLREIIKNPSLGEKIPDGSTVIFMDKDHVLSEKELPREKKKLIRVKRTFEVI